MLKRSINMLLWLQAHIAFNSGMYVGYSRTKRTVEDFENKAKDFPVKGDNSKSQNQIVGTLFIGGNYHIHDFEIDLNGFLGSTLFKEKYFKNRIFGGGELSLLYYHNDKIAFGFLGGLDISRFQSNKYEYSLIEEEKNIDNFKNENTSTQIFPRFFMGLKTTYTLNPSIKIGIKYHCIFSKERNHQGTSFKSEKGITGPHLFNLPNIEINFTNKEKFFTHRILLGIELIKGKIK